MARKPRIEYQGAVYHVVVRGNQRQTVYRAPEDYQKYLSILEYYKERRGFRLYGYVLMKNHVHLVLEMGQVPVSKIMQGINQSYTMYFNRKYRKVGHLFQGRYKAILCDADSYLAVLVQYVHLNPVRAGIVARAGDYEWSGHRQYLGRDRGRLIDEEPVLRMFSEDKGAARRLLGKFVDGAIGAKHDPAFYGTTDSRLLGDEKFMDRVMERVDMSADVVRTGKKATLADLAGIVAKTTGVSIKDLCGRRRASAMVRARHIFSVAAVEAGHTGREVARFLDLDPASVSRKLAAADRVRSEVDSITIKKALRNATSKV